MYSYGRPCSVTFFRLNVAWGEKLFSCLAVWWDRPVGSSSKRERELGVWGPLWIS